MMKKFLALSLALLMLLCAVSCSGKGKGGKDGFDNYRTEDVIYTKYTAENGDVFYFETLDSQTVAITGFKGSDTPHAVTIPSAVKTSDDAEAGTKTVAAIDTAAFYATSCITTLTIPESVVSIGDYAFAKCAQLSAVTLSDKITSLGEGAFKDCVALASVTFPATSALTAVPAYCFWGCRALTEVTIPAYFKTVGNAAFKDCTGITKIVLSEGVETLGDQAFEGTESLADLTLPSTFTNTDPLEDLAFAGSEKLYLENIHIPAGESAAKSYVEKMILSEKPVEE